MIWGISWQNYSLWGLESGKWNIFLKFLVFGFHDGVMWSIWLRNTMDVSVSTRSENEELPALLACFSSCGIVWVVHFWMDICSQVEVAAPLQVLCWQVLVELWVCPILECEETFEAEHVELEFADGALIAMLGAVLHCWVPKSFASMSSLVFVRKHATSYKRWTDTVCPDEKFLIHVPRRPHPKHLFLLYLTCLSLFIFFLSQCLSLSLLLFFCRIMLPPYDLLVLVLWLVR